MGPSIQLMILVGSILLLFRSEKALLSAGVFAGVWLFFDLLMGESLGGALIAGAVQLAYTFGWFSLMLWTDSVFRRFLLLFAGILVPTLLKVAI